MAMSTIKNLFLGGKPMKDWVREWEVVRRLTVFACSCPNEMANTGTENTSTKSDYLPTESRDLLLPPLEELVQGMVIISLC